MVTGTSLLQSFMQPRVSPCPFFVGGFLFLCTEQLCLQLCSLFNFPNSLSSSSKTCILQPWLWRADWEETIGAFQVFRVSFERGSTQRPSQYLLQFEATVSWLLPSRTHKSRTPRPYTIFFQQGKKKGVNRLQPKPPFIGNTHGPRTIRIKGRGTGKV